MSKKTSKYKKLTWGKWFGNHKTAYITLRNGKEYAFCDLYRDKRFGVLEPYFYSGDNTYWKIIMEIKKEKKMMKHIEDCFKAHCDIINDEYKALIQE